MIERMTDSTPVFGSLAAGVLAQGSNSGSWWLPLLLQIISLGVGYLQGKKVEAKKKNLLDLLDASNANQEPHGGAPLPDDSDQT